MVATPSTTITNLPEEHHPGDVLRDIAKGLDDSIRQGGRIDMPEGTRYIVISDTATTMIAQRLSSIADEMERKQNEHP